jgi:YegS/Rv2252/BmrU family lipid kinase
VHICCVVNGRISRKPELETALEFVRNSLPTAKVEVLISEHEGHAIELARAASAGCDYLIAVGGDGTLNEVVNGCLQADCASPPVLGVLARGTANDFTKSTHLTGGVDQLLELIRSESHRSIDAGQVSYQDARGNPGQRYFLNVAEVGIGAEVVERVNRGKRRLGANLTFLRSALLSLIRFRKRRLVLVRENGMAAEGEYLAVVAANGRYFGSGLCIAPEARLDNGKLRLTLVGGINIADFLRHVRDLKQAETIDHPEIHYESCHWLDVSATTGTCPVEADGEFLGYTPARIRILPGRLKFLM